MERSESIAEISKALNTFRTAVKQPVKSASNPFFKSKYVALEGVVDAIDSALKDTGMSYVQEATSEGNQVSVTTLLLHESGEWIELTPLTLPVTKNDAQAFGSAETYARRYSLSAAFGITSDLDDDGNAASSNPPAQQPTKPKRSTTQVRKETINELAESISKIKNVEKSQVLVEVYKNHGIESNDEIKNMTVASQLGVMKSLKMQLEQLEGKK
ncbi:ERF family protein [Latilactobacillus curvatus]|uniref:ERF family protein n=1 Tax=Latilactobacillus curvatus TaxID=28038 RepID=UPI00223B93BB|nr:ERF family protein [Latilactobacillus curvatus]MCS8616176.1 single-stranded DNA-binding protein [Latilactobacillus curvatus]